MPHLVPLGWKQPIWAKATSMNSRSPRAGKDQAWLGRLVSILRALRSRLRRRSSQRTRKPQCREITTDPRPSIWGPKLAVALAKLNLDALTVADAVADVATTAGENVTTAIRADLKEFKAEINARVDRIGSWLRALGRMGRRKGVAYNHFAICYHPLFLFITLPRRYAAARNVHSADDSDDLTCSRDRQQAAGSTRVAFGADGVREHEI